MVATSCPRVNYSRERDERASRIQLKKQMSLHCCWQKRHPGKTWQQREPFTAKSHTSLRVNVGEQRPTLSRMGKTTEVATRGGRQPQRKCGWNQHLQHLQVSGKGRHELGVKANAKTRKKRDFNKIIRIEAGQAFPKRVITTSLILTTSQLIHQPICCKNTSESTVNLKLKDD